MLQHKHISHTEPTIHSYYVVFVITMEETEKEWEFSDIKQELLLLFSSEWEVTLVKAFL